MTTQRQYKILSIFLLILFLFSGCGENQLEKALKNNNLTRAKFILFIKPGLVETKNEDGRTLLHQAVLRGQREIGEFLIKKDAKINAQDRYGFTPLHYAAMKGQDEIARTLIEACADLAAKNHYDYTPLHFAAERGYENIATLLIAHGADYFAKDKNGMTPAQLAEQCGYWRVAELLFPFHDAAKTGNLAKLDSLIKVYPDLINCQDHFARTPLHVALGNNQLHAAELLRSKGANINAKDNFGFTPSYYSAQESQQRIGINLLEPAIDDEVDHIVNDVLHKYDHINIGLVVNGAIILTKAYGENSLQYAEAWGSTSKPVTAMMVMHLVSHGKIESIDDPIWKYSARYKNCMPVPYENDTLSIRHLLIHQSGVPHNDEPTWKGNKLNLKFKPGTKDQYSTPGYGILGHIIEDITGLSYSDAVKEYIGKPSGATSFWAGDDFRAPGARVYSTVEDMAKFSIGVMNCAYVPADLFYNEMIQYHNGPTGIGWGIQNLDSEDLVVFHGGSNGHPQAYLSIKPKKKLSVCILAQARDRYSFELDQVAERLMEFLDHVTESNLLFSN